MRPLVIFIFITITTVNELLVAQKFNFDLMVLEINLIEFRQFKSNESIESIESNISKSASFNHASTSK
jgi:hypothetical protein